MDHNQQIPEPHDQMRSQAEGGKDQATKAASKLLKWYKSITPRNKPEDFSALREEFEKTVAEDVASEG